MDMYQQARDVLQRLKVAIEQSDTQRMSELEQEIADYNHAASKNGTKAHQLTGIFLQSSIEAAKQGEFILPDQLIDEAFPPEGTPVERCHNCSELWPGNTARSELADIFAGSLVAYDHLIKPDILGQEDGRRMAFLIANMLSSNTHKVPGSSVLWKQFAQHLKEHQEINPFASLRVAVVGATRALPDGFTSLFEQFHNINGRNENDGRIGVANCQTVVPEKLDYCVTSNVVGSYGMSWTGFHDIGSLTSAIANRTKKGGKVMHIMRNPGVTYFASDPEFLDFIGQKETDDIYFHTMVYAQDKETDISPELLDSKIKKLMKREHTWVTKQDLESPRNWVDR